MDEVDVDLVVNLTVVKQVVVDHAVDVDVKWFKLTALCKNASECQNTSL